MNEGFADAASKRVRRAVRLGLNEIGRRAVAEIRQSIGVRVQYIGSEVIRSEPGEPPRREERRHSSSLWRSIKYTRLAGGYSLEELLIYTYCEYARALELGNPDTNLEPRPFWEPARLRVKRFAPALLRRLVAENLKRAADADADFSTDF